MTYGEYARRLMIRDGINADAITVIYNSLDVHEQNLHYELLNKEGVSSSDGAFRIVFVGRITPQKRLDLLVTAVLSLLDKGYNIQVDIVGDGFYLKSLKILTQRFEDKFHFHGSQHTEVYLSKLLYCANVCISPGNVGLTAMHSLVYGTPVITHNRKSQQMPEFEIIRDGFNGSLFEYDDIGSLEEKIIFWYELLRSREDIRSDCRSALLRYYTPWNQSRIILDVLKRYD
jgi:glycosyltransferase involved in cell wall biosynthesis